jgi:hypothetical protein
VGFGFGGRVVDKHWIMKGWSKFCVELVSIKESL